MAETDRAEKSLDLERLAEIEADCGNDRARLVYEVAKEYISLGWPIIPIEYGGKLLPSRTTLAKRGLQETIRYQDGAVDPVTIDQWFHPKTGLFKGFNIGLVCGSVVSALDLDLKGDTDGYKEYLDRIGPPPSRTPSQKTPSGGYHFVFQHVKGFRSSIGLFPGVDTRGSKRDTGEPGSHIVVYPSVVDGPPSPSGAPEKVMYRWQAGGLPAIAPEELLKKLDAVVDIRTRKPVGATSRGNENIDDEDYFPDATIDDVRKALEFIDADDYDTWRQIGMALHSEWDGAEGFDLFHEWSKKSDKYKSEKDCWGKWSTFNSETEKGVRINTVFYHARRGGYRKEGEPSPFLSEQLRRNDKGGLQNSNHNLWVLIQSPEFAEEFGGRLEYDTFRQEARAGGVEFVNEKYTWIARWLSSKFMFERGRDNVRDYARMVAYENQVDSLRDWANSLSWDGEDRLDKLAEILCAQNDYQKSAIKRWLIGGIARALMPGCTSTHMLILFGDQGVGKSRFFRAISPDKEWFSDSTTFKFSRDTSHRDEELKLQGKFIIEVAELAGIFKSDFSDLKTFLSTPVGTVRRPYDTDAIDLPRRCIFGGTTNVDAVISDTTGGRRFAFLKVGSKKINVKWVEENREQIWAQAKKLFQAREAWWFNDDEFVEQMAENREFGREHPWKSAIMEWIGDKSRFHSDDIFDYVLHMPTERRTQAHLQTIKGILEQEEWRCTTTKVEGESKKPRLWKNPDASIDNLFTGKRWVSSSKVDNDAY